ncbi:MAG: hypothetical protein L6R41_007944, partial [Letrouitia leprolyta]
VEIKKAYKFGGEQIPFTQEEISSLRNFGEPVIRIIGFKPISMLPIWANLKPATFIYPSEEDYVGSTRVFAALHQQLLSSKKMGIVWYIARTNAAPVIAALYPGAEQRTSSSNNEDNSGTQTMPPGLWLIPLPYADDIRQNPELASEVIRAPESLIDRMRTVIQQLQLPKAKYDPMKYPNPALQWHYRILQALALDEELPEQAEDKTVPRYRQIEKGGGVYALVWGWVLGEWHREWEKENGAVGLTMGVGAGSKRAAGDDGGGAKRVKVDKDAKDAVGDEGMEKAFGRNGVGKLTVPVLQGWLRGKGLDAKGKKGELVERVEEWFERKLII